MPHVIAEPCVGTKDTACVKACPVDCIHPYEGGSKGSFSAEKQLYIDPAECIDCAACVPACPVEAIFAEGDLPSQWQKYTAINRDWFANLGAAPAAAAAAAGGDAPAAKTPVKKAEPKPEPKPEPLVLSPEEMYKPLTVLREDVAVARGVTPGEGSVRRSPALIGLAAAVVLLFVYAVSNNFAKNMNTTVAGRLASLAMGEQKPTLAGGMYSIERELDGKKYVIKAHDSILGSRTLHLQVPAKPFESLYHKDEKYFAALNNQTSRFYYEFVDEKSDGTLDSALAVREIWSDGHRFLGRYQVPTVPTPELQALYAQSIQEVTAKLGLKK